MEKIVIFNGLGLSCRPSHWRVSFVQGKQDSKFRGCKIVKDLGCMNGWREYPKEYTSCCETEHQLVVVKKGNCWYQYTCPICQITWDVDSSD